MSEKKSSYGFLIFLALLFLGIRKKGIGTTLFGVGTQLDLSKPIEDLDAFIKASEEETRRGFSGSIKPKGIYYQIKAGDLLARKLIVNSKESTCSPSEIQEASKTKFFEAPEDFKVYNPCLEYINQSGPEFLLSSLMPPFVTWPGPEEVIVRPDCAIFGKYIIITESPGNYSRFGKS